MIRSREITMTGVKSEVIVPGPLRRHIVLDVPLSLRMG